MAKTRVNPTPEKPDAATQAVFDRLIEDGYSPSLLSYGKYSRVIIRKPRRGRRILMQLTNANPWQERDNK